jgi:hypothetical protein
MEPDVAESEAVGRHTSATRRADPEPVSAKGNGNAATVVAPLLEGLFGDRMPVRFEFWDGSGTGPTDGPGTLVIRSPDAISRMLWDPGELGIGRAYVAGELEADGDISVCSRRSTARRGPTCGRGLGQQSLPCGRLSNWASSAVLRPPRR